VPKDDTAAIYWFRRAGSSMLRTASGDPAAEESYWVGQHFRERGDLTESRKWLRIAAQGGYKDGEAVLQK
jgi:TPR repeat protein